MNTDEQPEQITVRSSCEDCGYNLFRLDEEYPTTLAGQDAMLQTWQCLNCGALYVEEVLIED